MRFEVTYILEAARQADVRDVADLVKDAINARKAGTTRVVDGPYIASDGDDGRARDPMDSP